MTRIYRYILVHDHGIAPCLTDGLITLGTCKATIRRCAGPGDWVLGFRPGPLERGVLLWGGRVERVLPHGEYEHLYRGRPDALYREAESGKFQRIDPNYHPTDGEKARDLSGPVLIFERGVSRHLGGQPMPLPHDLMHLAASGRGHRVSGMKAGDLDRLAVWFSGLSSNLLPDEASRSVSCSRAGRPRTC